MDHIQLSATLEEFFAHFNSSDIGTIFRQWKNNQCSRTQSLICKYSLGAIVSNRPLDTAMIFMAGASGAGKSSTINTLFDEPELCKTSSPQSVTKEPTVVKKKLRVTTESPDVVGNLCFIDTPGAFDTDSKNEATNLASLRKFIETSVELAPRSQLKSSLKYFVIEGTVYPNIVLFVVTAADNRLKGPDSFFRKSMELLKRTGNLVDVKNSNLIIVLSHAMVLPPKKERFEKVLEEKTKIIRDIVEEVFNIREVDVIPVENNPEDFDLVKVGDFYELPNGDYSHRNLFDAMLRCFERSQDLIGKLFVAWYLNPHCPERATKAEFETMDSDANAAEIEAKKKALRNLIISEPSATVTHSYDYQNLGFCYCPVTEEIKSVNLLDSEDLHEAKVGNAKFMIHKSVKVRQKTTSQFRRLTFFEKEEYQNYFGPYLRWGRSLEITQKF